MGGLKLFDLNIDHLLGATIGLVDCIRYNQMKNKSDKEIRRQYICDCNYFPFLRLICHDYSKRY